MDYKTQICSLIALIEQNIKNKTDYQNLEKAVGFSYHHIRDTGLNGINKTKTVKLDRFFMVAVELQ